MATKINRGIFEVKVGLGDLNSVFCVYIANRPDYADLKSLEMIRAVVAGEVADIGKRCGNGWRKVFNVYAKLVYALNMPQHQTTQYLSWQNWRDAQLLAEKSGTSLLFSRPQLSSDNKEINIVMGKHYAKQCFAEKELHWLNHEFAINESLRLFVCPYFDYRQLSNQKIMFLCELIRSRGLF